MTDFIVNAPTADEAAALRAENPTNTHSYPAPADGYVRGTQIAKALNTLLSGAGVKEIKSQMVYNYISKGYLGDGKDGSNYPHVKADEATEWVKLQYARRTADIVTNDELENEADEA